MVKRKYRSGFHFSGFANNNKFQKASIKTQQISFSSKTKKEESFRIQNPLESEINHFHSIPTNVNFDHITNNSNLEVNEDKLIKSHEIKKIELDNPHEAYKLIIVEEKVNQEVENDEDLETEKRDLKLLTIWAIIASGLSLFLPFGLFALPAAIILWVARNKKVKEINLLKLHPSPKLTEEQLNEKKIKELKENKIKAGFLLAIRIVTAVIGSLLLTLGILVAVEFGDDYSEGSIPAMIIGFLLLILSGIARWLRRRTLKKIEAAESEEFNS